MNPVATIGEEERHMNSTHVSYVCVNPDHVSVGSAMYPFVTLHDGQWAMCVADGRQEIRGSHNWKPIEPSSVEMLTFGGMTRRSA